MSPTTYKIIADWFRIPLTLSLTSFLQPVGLYPGKYSLSDTPGDCSLTISKVDPSLDEGDWECQVTSSSFQSQDALASPRARLTVQGT